MSKVFVPEHECVARIRTLRIESKEGWNAWARNNPRVRGQLQIPANPEAYYSNLNFWKRFAGNYPKYWEEFKQLSLLNARQSSLWARYADQYRAASAYRGISFSMIDEKTKRGYSAALGVFLAYSALELCLRAKGSNHRAPPPIHDHELASRLRSALGKNFMQVGGLSRPLARQLRSFLQEGDDASNVVIIAQAIGHLFAQGLLMPMRSGSLGIQGVRAVQDLADHVLLESSIQFRNHIWPARRGDAVFLPPPTYSRI